MSATEKKTDAWMPLWIGAYLADTTKLTTVQHGAYLLLLMAYWRERGPLPNDDEDLRSITKCDRVEWKKIRPKVEQFFTVADGVWWHKRVEAEIAAADRRKAASVAKAQAAAGARWKKPPGGAQSNAPSMPEAQLEDVLNECPTPTPSSSIEEEKEKAPPALADQPPEACKEPKPDRPPRPIAPPPKVADLVAVGFDEAIAAEFIAYKARKKAPLTARAWADHLRECAVAGWIPQDAAERVMAKEWRGFEARYVAADRPKSGVASNGEAPWQRRARLWVDQMSGGHVSAKPPEETDFSEYDETRYWAVEIEETDDAPPAPPRLG